MIPRQLLAETQFPRTGDSISLIFFHRSQHNKISPFKAKRGESKENKQKIENKDHLAILTALVSLLRDTSGNKSAVPARQVFLELY